MVILAQKLLAGFRSVGKQTFFFFCEESDTDMIGSGSTNVPYYDTLYTDNSNFQRCHFKNEKTTKTCGELATKK